MLQQLKLGAALIQHTQVRVALDPSLPAPSLPASWYAFVYVLAGVGLGCISSGATQITADMMLAAARALCTQVTDIEREQGAVLPNIARLRCGQLLPAFAATPLT